jgi:hypothetical protein
MTQWRTTSSGQIMQVLQSSTSTSPLNVEWAHNDSRSSRPVGACRARDAHRIACGGGSQPAPTSPSVVMSAEARAYLEHAVSLMQAHSYKRVSIDWDAFRSTVFARVSAAQSTSDTYPGIALGTSLLADRHTVRTSRRRQSRSGDGPPATE